MQVKSSSGSAEQQRLAGVIKGVHRQLRQKVKACTYAINYWSAGMQFLCTIGNHSAMYFGCTTNYITIFGYILELEQPRKPLKIP